MSVADKSLIMSANNVNIAEKQRRVYDAGHKAAIERYCPEFTESGAVVECYPVEGFPLNVVSNITPIQSGSGEASPTNIRPIIARNSVKVTIANETESAEYNAEFGQGVYAGTFDFSTGLLTLTHEMLTLTGTESGWTSSGTANILNYGMLGGASQVDSAIYGWCSHAPTVTTGNFTWNDIRKTHAKYDGIIVRAAYFGLADNSVQPWKDYLVEQADKGTPVQILFELETPLTVQLTPQEILALSGTNTIQSDTGNTTVTGKGDGSAMFAQLKDTIISLGGEV